MLKCMAEVAENVCLILYHRNIFTLTIELYNFIQSLCERPNKGIKGEYGAMEYNMEIKLHITGDWIGCS